VILVRFGLFITGLLAVFAVEIAAAEISREAQLHAYAANGDYEPAVLSIIESIEAAQLEQALQKADAHIADFPKSRVGHLLRADILQGMSGNLTELGAGSNLPDSMIEGLKHQIKIRWAHTTCKLNPSWQPPLCSGG